MTRCVKNGVRRHYRKKSSSKEVPKLGNSEFTGNFRELWSKKNNVILNIFSNI